MLVDGVPVRGHLNGQVDLSQLSLNNVERVEIVNGPMAVEYGTNSLAGTINLITKSNHREGLQLTATGQYETIGQHEFNLSATHSNGEGRNLQASINQYYFDGWSPTDALIEDSRPSSQTPTAQPSGTPSCSAPVALVANGTRRLD